jgi:hypothetical protein
MRKPHIEVKPLTHKKILLLKIELGKSSCDDVINYLIDEENKKYGQSISSTD